MTAPVVLDVARLPSLEARDLWLRHLDPGEMAGCLQRRHADAHLAARLAGKRAVLSALGHPAGISDLDVVFPDGPGVTPRITVAGAQVERIAVSLSHTATHAGAYAVQAPACGFDLLDLPRWRRAMQRSGDAVVARVTSPVERSADAAAGRDSATLAGRRFSLKECVIKALGGLPRGGGFHDIEVVVDTADAPPRIQLTGACAVRARQFGLRVAGAAASLLHGDLLQSSVVLTEAA